MDKKISQFDVSSSVLPTDIIPIVSSGLNKSVSVGVLSLNLPNFGNKGISKNVVNLPIGSAIQLTGSLYKLVESISPYTLGPGSEGQQITIISIGANTVNLSSISLGMVSGSTATLVFSTSWYVLSAFQTVITTP